MKIGILSDTHGFLDDAVIHNLQFCDEVWHLGDIGTLEVFDKLSQIKPLRAVYGNIDGHDIRLCCPLKQHFILEGFKIYMTHIGGYPGRYEKGIRAEINTYQPDIFLCGHSHILRILPDKMNNLLYINPGASGKYGIHKVKTMIMMDLKDKKINDLKVVEMGNRNVI